MGRLVGFRGAKEDGEINEEKMEQQLRLGGKGKNLMMEILRIGAVVIWRKG